MKGSVRTFRLGVMALAIVTVPEARAQVLGVEKAVELALTRSTAMVNAEASVVNARSGVYSAYSGVLPSISADWSRSGSLSTKNRGDRSFGAVVFRSPPTDAENYSSTEVPSLSGTWSILDLSSIQGLRSARTSLKAAELRRTAARADVALETRRLFYNVVRAEHLVVVSNESAHLARDDERRVRALFEVGSVSKSDLLVAQVRTAQAQLDSISRHLAVANERVALARQLGQRESEMGQVDTVLTAVSVGFDTTQLSEDALFGEAERNRPDLKAADAERRAARSGLTAANFGRLPYVSVSGGVDWEPRSTFRNKNYVSPYTGADSVFVTTGTSQSDRDLSGRIALTWNLFSGMATESRIAAARARLLVAQETYDQTSRNLRDEVHSVLLTYLQTVAALEVAERGLASAEENVRLTQQKYNVGSATILELIDAQVQLQQARSDRVSALAGIRLSEAALNRVRGRGE